MNVPTMRDLGDLLNRSTPDASAQLGNMPAGDARAVENGRVTAHYEVISLLQEQAVAPNRAGLPCDPDLDLDPERDLL
jgi:hypothetical protein